MYVYVYIYIGLPLAINFRFIDYSDWHPGQYGTPRLNQNCLFLYKSTGWNWHDASCSLKRGYICEMSI